MMVTLSGSVPVSAPEPQVSTPPASTAVASSAASNRTTAQDSVSLSPQGQQLSRAAQDVDHDGDAS